MASIPEGPRVVIVGGGFAGLEAARRLSRAPVRVLLLDSRNHHLFQPLLYQVATAGLNAADIAAPIRRILQRQRNTQVLLGKVDRVDVGRRRLLLSDDRFIDYEFLVLATGATHSYFGRDDWAGRAPGLKTIEDALEIRRRVLFAFEQAEWASDEDRRRDLMTFVVVGAGPTGVELAGALAELARHTLADEFRVIDPSSARIVLCEGGERVLPAYPPDLSEEARRSLVALGVEVRLGALVTDMDAESVAFGQERLRAGTILWAAGVRASPLARALGAPLDRAGRVRVQKDLSVPGHPEVLVAGDLASLEDASGREVPGVAPAAMQMGRHAADSIRASLAGEPRQAFRYRDKGSLATIGRASAVADLGRLHLSGFVAWSAWLAVHIFFLVGFRNRVLVLIQWAWAYLTFQRGARLITGPIETPLDEPAGAPPATEAERETASAERAR